MKLIGAKKTETKTKVKKKGGKEGQKKKQNKGGKGKKNLKTKRQQRTNKKKEKTNKSLKKIYKVKILTLACNDICDGKVALSLTLASKSYQLLPLRSEQNQEGSLEPEQGSSEHIDQNLINHRSKTNKKKKHAHTHSSTGSLFAS
jgi:hypothetical protein